MDMMMSIVTQERMGKGFRLLIFGTVFCLFSMELMHFYLSFILFFYFLKTQSGAFVLNSRSNAIGMRARWTVRNAPPNAIPNMELL